MIYALVRVYEIGDWDIVSDYADRIGIRSADVGTMYVEAAAWVAGVSGLGF